MYCPYSCQSAEGYTYVLRVLLSFLHFLSRENMLHIFSGFPLFQMKSILVCHTRTHNFQSLLQLVIFLLRKWLYIYESLWGHDWGFGNPPLWELYVCMCGRGGVGVGVVLA